MRIELPKTAVDAIVELGYRGTADRKALARIGPALDGHRSPRAKMVSLEVADGDLDLLRKVADGKRAPGVAALAKSCSEALKAVPHQPVVRRGPREAPADPKQRGAARKCILCGKQYEAEQFAGANGTRCLSCRESRARDVIVREIPGGAPGTAR